MRLLLLLIELGHCLDVGGNSKSLVAVSDVFLFQILTCADVNLFQRVILAKKLEKLFSMHIWSTLQIHTSPTPSATNQV